MKFNKNKNVDNLGRYHYHAIDKINVEQVNGSSGKNADLTPSVTSSTTINILQNMEKSNIKKSLDVDSECNTLSKQQQEYFKDSKVRDENGNLLVVYHGTSEEFTVFDREKGRHNMDIQGSFFSPWELDASGYGNNVRAFYLNITNPASESLGYKALRRFQSQNNTGVKAREYLESLGYEGFKHGLNRESQTDKNSPEILEIGKILKNSILVNEADPTQKAENKGATDTLILIGAGFDGENIHIVRSSINKFTNTLVDVNVLHAATTKKEAVGQNVPRAIFKKKTHSNASYISISNLLDIVNKLDPGTLSLDVYKVLNKNTNRPNSDIKNLRFSKDVENYDMESLIKQNEKLQKSVEYYRYPNRKKSVNMLFN